jgi:endo-1,4-beta-xylanase
MDITRRESLAMALAMGLTGCGGGNGSGPAIVGGTPTPPALDTTSLATIAKAKGIAFGSTVGAGNATSGSFGNPDYARMLEADCAIFVPENEMKWQSIRPSADSYDFAKFDAMLDYAEAKGMAMRGHTLLWHRTRWMPEWSEKHDYGTRPASEAERLLVGHIKTVTDRYRGRVNSYDVVNETVLEDSSLAETALSKAMGGTLPLVDLAFRTARAQLPGAQLVYNDYMSWEPGNEKHRAGVLKLLEGFKARGVPVDALGLQSHIRIDSLDSISGRPARQEQEWRKFLDEVTAMGYDLLITEFDVNDQVAPSDITARDQMVADFARSYFDLTLSYKQLKSILLWGMCDSFSWLQSFEPLRVDGAAKRPCPYDATFQRKPLHAAIARALSSTAVR